MKNNKSEERKQNKMSMNIGYEVNHIEGTIIVSKKFLKAAGVLNSTEYNILRQLRLDNPEYKIAQRDICKKEGKKTYRNLNFKNMEMYISETCGKDSAEMAEFERVKELAKIQPGPYAYVKTWFLKKFPAYQEVAQIAPEEAYKPKMTLLTNN